MANHMKLCGCRMCRYGLRPRSGSIAVKAVVRKNRRAVKRAIRLGKEPDRTVSVPYTD